MERTSPRTPVLAALAPVACARTYDNGFELVGAPVPAAYENEVISPMPRVYVPAHLLNALCKKADAAAWRRDTLTKEIGTLILRCALSAPEAP